MIDMTDIYSKRQMIVGFILAAFFILPLFDKKIVFLLKDTEKTNGIVINSDLNTNESIVEYEVDSVKYIEKVELNYGLDKNEEIELIYNVKKPTEIAEGSLKSVFITTSVISLIFFVHALSLKSTIGGKKIYNDKKATIVEGKIFEIVEKNTVCRVCLKSEGYDQVFYLDSDINLKPVLEKLNIYKLPIYLCKNGLYRVDSRPIEEKIEILKERITLI